MITPSYSPRLGGVEQHVWYLSQELRKIGWQVTVLTRQFSGLADEEVIQGIPVYRFAFPSRRYTGLLMLWWRLLTRWWRLVWQADIIHIHDVFIWYLPLRLLFFWKPVVTTFHGWEGIYPVPRKNRIIRQVAAGLSTKTIAIGKYVEKYYHFTADAILYGAVQVPVRPTKKERLLLYVGRLDYDTGLPVLLQALQQGAWPGRVVFCGDGLLREQAELVGEVKGFVDPKPYLKKAQAVFAGGYLSILEAFAYQCAVIAAEKNSLKKDYYLLSPFASWLEVVNSPEAVHSCLAHILGHSATARFRRAKAFAWVKKQTWSSVAQRCIALYTRA